MLLPTESTHTANGDRQARHFSVLSSEITAAVSRISVHDRVEPWVTLLAAFTAVLARYCREEETIGHFSKVRQLIRARECGEYPC